MARRLRRLFFHLGRTAHHTAWRHAMDPRSTAPRQAVLPALYRSAMRMTRRHGMGTLSRINRRMFPLGQIIQLETGADFFVPPDPHFFGYIVEHERHITRLIAESVEEGDLCV